MRYRSETNRPQGPGQGLGLCPEGTAEPWEGCEQGRSRVSLELGCQKNPHERDGLEGMLEAWRRLGWSRWVRTRTGRAKGTEWREEAGRNSEAGWWVTPMSSVVPKTLPGAGTMHGSRDQRRV